ncbi:hypothetical protein [Streptomyces sp. BE303]|uniref:hypothetical protein n=1 Tax=Streptomyces sp. BE303 TaxID=3002528 RepID=UPI002E77E827|nr:hypothetical protein [Streptomyces sp. BE303]MED7951866.1 hypothetical protein [Streptomyces sp. BE303]
MVLRRLGPDTYGFAHVLAREAVHDGIPAAVLARTLGIDITVAVKWQRAAAGEWAAYAAEVSRRTTS